MMTHESGSLDSGYVLFAPMNDSTFLIDKCGDLVHIWPATQAGSSFVSLLPEGNILRAGNYSFAGGGTKSGKLQIQDWDGNVLWSYVIMDSTHRQHHDMCMLPNGDILVLVTEIHPNTEALA